MTRVAEMRHEFIHQHIVVARQNHFRTENTDAVNHFEGAMRKARAGASPNLIQRRGLRDFQT
jgi:hypothetical protein